MYAIVTQPLPAVASDKSVYQNVAQGGKASQDSTSNSGVASRAIDGDRNGDFL